MSDPVERLETLMALHGADVSRWPGDALAFGCAALKDPALAARIAKEREFEEWLLKRHMPEPSSGFADRVILAATRTQRHGMGFWLARCLSDLSPATLAAVLVVGFALGFGIHPATGIGRASAALQAPADDEAAIL